LTLSAIFDTREVEEDEEQGEFDQTIVQQERELQLMEKEAGDQEGKVHKKSHGNVITLCIKCV